MKKTKRKAKYTPPVRTPRNARVPRAMASVPSVFTVEERKDGLWEIRNASTKEKFGPFSTLGAASENAKLMNNRTNDKQRSLGVLG